MDSIRRGAAVAKLVAFPKVDPQWLFDRDCVQFYALHGNEVLRCLVSGEALMTHFGARDFSADEAIRAFNEHRPEIEDSARRKILEGDYKRGDEVLLRMADFPNQPTTIQPPRHRSLGTVVSPVVNAHEVFRRVVDQANSLMEEEIIRGLFPVTAVWVPVTMPPSDLVTVALSLHDTETDAAVNDLLTQDEAEHPLRLRSFLVRLWGDLLQARSHRQLAAITSKSG